MTIMVSKVYTVFNPIYKVLSTLIGISVVSELCAKSNANQMSTNMIFNFLKIVLKKAAN